MIGSAIFIFVLVCAPIVDVNAQETAAAAAVDPNQAPVAIPPSQIFQNVLLQVVIEKVNLVDLPEDLQLKAADVLSNAQAGFAVCDSLTVPPGAIWQQKRCAVFQMKNTLLQLSAIQKEAAARNATVVSTVNSE